MSKRKESEEKWKSRKSRARKGANMFGTSRPCVQQQLNGANFNT